MEKKNSIVSLLVGGVVAVAVYFGVSQMLNPSIDTQLMNIASDINKSCPVMVDEYTQLDNVNALPGKHIQYNYTLLGVEKNDLDTSYFENDLRPVLLNNLRTSPDFESFRALKVKMSYAYKFPDGTYITKLSFEAKEYATELVINQFA